MNKHRLAVTSRRHSSCLSIHRNRRQALGATSSPTQTPTRTGGKSSLSTTGDHLNTTGKLSSVSPQSFLLIIYPSDSWHLTDNRTRDPVTRTRAQQYDNKQRARSVNLHRLHTLSQSRQTHYAPTITWGYLWHRCRNNNVTWRLSIRLDEHEGLSAHPDWMFFWSYGVKPEDRRISRNHHVGFRRDETGDYPWEYTNTSRNFKHIPSGGYSLSYGWT